MKRLLKYITAIFILLLLFCIVLFLWASSPTLSEKEYAKLITNEYQQITSTDSIYSIVTYNIGHLSGLYRDPSIRTEAFYESNFTHASKLLNSLNPNIIVFQDIDFNSKRSYNKNQSEKFAEFGYNNVAEAVYWDKKHILSPYWPITNQTGKVVSGLSILSKFSIIQHERILLENNINLPFYKKKFHQDRIVQIIKLMVNKKTIILINVHLENISKSGRIIQFNKILYLFKKYSLNHPTILLGDFNSSINNKDAIIKQLFELDGVGHASYKNLDYIFYNQNAIEVIQSRVLDEFATITNHVPLIMNFKLKDDL